MNERLVHDMYGSLEDAKGRISSAIEVADLGSTEGLCHQLNFGIALYLATKLENVSLATYNSLTAGDLHRGGPVVATVAYGTIKENPISHVNHGFPLILGVESSPMIVDGANDQVDPRVPFLIAKVEGNDFKSIRSALKKSTKHGIEDYHPVYQERDKFMYEKTKEIVNALYQEGQITGDEMDIAYDQIELENQAGLSFMFASLNRPWLTYFVQSLGIEYPNLQVVHEKVRERMNKKYNARIAVTGREKELIKMAGRLKEEGLI